MAKSIDYQERIIIIAAFKKDNNSEKLKALKDSSDNPSETNNYINQIFSGKGNENDHNNELIYFIKKP